MNWGEWHGHMLQMTESCEMLARAADLYGFDSTPLIKYAKDPGGPLSGDLEDLLERMQIRTETALNSPPRKLWLVGVNIPERGEGDAKAADVLHPDDKKILEALAKARTTQFQSDLEPNESTGLSRKTLSARLKELRKMGLVSRPRGPKGGDAITEKGRAQITR
jgi:uncharacterized membrane protein